MRPIPGSTVLLAVSGVAGAHVLAGDEGIPAQLGHQLIDRHHLPLTAIVVIGGIFILRHFFMLCRQDKDRAP